MVQPLIYEADISPRPSSQTTSPWVFIQGGYEITIEEFSQNASNVIVMAPRGRTWEQVMEEVLRERAHTWEELAAL